MTLIHQTEFSEIHCGDAAEILPGLATESFALVVTDPPYGKEWQSNVRAEAFVPIHGDESSEEQREDIHQVLIHCVRLVGQKRHLYVFGPSDVLEGLKVSEATELIWDKTTMGAGDMTSKWGPAHEPISFVVSLHRHGGKTGNSAVPVRMRKGTVLRFPRQTGRKVRHPSEKPVPLLRELIESSSRQGETVLDPYAGIGSAGVAAVLSGRKALLIEINEEYAGMAVKRVRKAEAMAKASKYF